MTRTGFFLLIVGILLLAAGLFAGSHTISTTAAQDIIITRARTEWNTRNLPGSPFATDTEFVEYQCKERMQDVVAQMKAYDRDAICTYWATATNAQKNTLCTTIGRPSTTTNPCNLCQ